MICNRTTRGFSLVEVIFYAAIVVILIMTVRNFFFSLNTAYTQSRYSNAEIASITTLLDRLDRAIRNADSIDLLGSTLNASPGVLALNATDDNDLSETIKFYLQNGAVKFDRNGTYVGPLTSADAKVTELIFRRVNTTYSNAIKIELSIQASSTLAVRVDKFYLTVALGRF